MFKKKGQITVFIILGIVILLGVIGFIYILNKKIDEIKVPVERVAIDLPNWAEPINLYVEECIQTIAIKGFKNVGEHGGYIDLNNDWLSGKTFSLSENPTESDAVLLSKKGFWPVAYWWYLESPNDCINCEMNSLMPLLSEVEEQMNRYMNTELEKCLDNFDVFKQQGFTIETKSIKTNTSIRQEDVGISIEYPIDIIKGDIRTRIPNFYLELDLKFREIMELAFLTTLNQISEQVQEDILMHLISIYSGVSSPNKMAPIGWVDHKSSALTWNIDNIRNNLKQYVLGSNIPSIQINKTRDAKHITTTEDPLMQGLYDVMYLDFLPVNYQNLALNFLL